MKKTIKILSLITTICAINATAGTAYAYQPKSGLYVGLDVLRSDVKHKYLAEGVSDEGSGGINGQTTSAKSNGFGVNLGYKFVANKLFIAPEIFFNQLKNSASDFDSQNDPAVSHNQLEVTRNYGAKVYFGANLFSKFNTFVNIGTSNVDFVFTRYNAGTVRNSTEQFVMVYGAGVSYDISNHLALRASYDWSQFSTRYDFNVEKNRILLQVAKIGVVYSF